MGDNTIEGDYYDILGVNKDAGVDVVTKRYRELARKYHPDRPGGVREKFEQITDAYQTLIEPNKRKEYDETLTENKARKIKRQKMDDEFKTSDMAFFFSSVFDFDPQKEPPKTKKQAPTTSIPLSLTLEQLYTGAKIKHGARLVHIRKGWIDGIKITLRGLGETPREDIPRGDLEFIVREVPHDRMKRNGDDLYTTIKITLRTALAGDEFTVKTLDGRILTVNKKEVVINPHTQWKIEGEGMPNMKNPDIKGNLFVNFDILFPESIDPELRKRLKSIMN